MRRAPLRFLLAIAPRGRGQPRGVASGSLGVPSRSPSVSSGSPGASSVPSGVPRIPSGPPSIPSGPPGVPSAPHRVPPGVPLPLWGRRALSSSPGPPHSKDQGEGEGLGGCREDDDDEGVEFGTLSTRFSARKFYHKATPRSRDLKLEEEGEEDTGRKPRRGPRNTPYWYFLRCKALIKEDKVCSLLVFSNNI